MMLLTLRGINSRLLSQSILYEDRFTAETRMSLLITRRLAYRKILITVTIKKKRNIFFTEIYTVPFDG